VGAVIHKNKRSVARKAKQLCTPGLGTSKNTENAGCFVYKIWYNLFEYKYSRISTVLTPNWLSVVATNANMKDKLECSNTVNSRLSSQLESELFVRTYVVGANLAVALLIALANRCW